MPMVQAALYQLVLNRRIGEYELPPGASLIACGNRENDRGVVHRMVAPLASRFVHLELKSDHQDWYAWAVDAGIAPEVIFFISCRPDLLNDFDPTSREKAFACPRTWHKVSNIINERADLAPNIERALFRGAVGKGPAVVFSAFLNIWREIPHPAAVIADPENANVPTEADVLVSLCGALFNMADDTNFDAIVTYAIRIRREIGEFLVTMCLKRDPTLQNSKGFIRWAAHRTR